MSKTTTRRDLLRVAAAGGVVAGLGLDMGIRRPKAATQEAEAADVQREHHGHHQPPVSGPMANATVSFGSWPAHPDNPLDRNANRSPGSRNGHQLIPHEVTIKAGGTVNFIIAGFHWIAVYDNGTEPSDIALPAPPSLFIDDANNRIFRGLHPGALTILTNVQPNSTAPLAPVVIPAVAAASGFAASPALFALGVRDRVEVVQFPKPGRYLVICLVRPHFVNSVTGEFEMFGHVKVLP